MTTLSGRETRKRIRSLRLEDSPEPAFSLHEKAAHLAYDWHSHSRHQLLYSLSGRIILESRNARWLLPPERAAWIPAGIRHRTTLDRSESVSVFFKSVPRSADFADIRVLRANSLLREMLLYSARWPAHGPSTGAERAMARSYFATLAHLSLDWIRQELPFRLPVPRDDAVKRAVQHLLDHLDSADMADAARASGQSVRTLRRRFLPATGLTWQQYARQARLLQAMDALLTTRRSILDVAASVGYESPGAFAKAFTNFAGTTPLAFRKSRHGSHRDVREKIGVIAAA